MSVSYSIDQLLDDRNSTLYAEVSSRAKVTLQSSDDHGWGEMSAGEDVTIFTAPTSHPHACFAHELLHAKLELEGWRRPRILRAEPGSTELVAFLYNQFAHWRMYPSFHQMGYPAKQFLNDRDSSELSQLLRRDIPTLEKLYQGGGGRPLADMAVALPFVASHSPHEEALKKPAILRRLIKVSDPKFLQNLKAFLRALQTEAGDDVVGVFTRFFEICSRKDVGFRAAL